MSELNLQKGIIIARPMYTAPEVLEGRQYSFSADIFSLAVMAWEMWYGRRVFSESFYSDVMFDYSSIKVNQYVIICKKIFIIHVHVALHANKSKHRQYKHVSTKEIKIKYQ